MQQGPIRVWNDSAAVMSSPETPALAPSPRPRPRKVAFVINSLHQEGPQKQLALLASHLPRDEFEVAIAVLERGGLLANQLADQGIDVEVIGQRLLWDPQTLWRLKCWLRKQKPDVVHTWTDQGNVYGRLAALWARVPHLIASERSLTTWKLPYQRLCTRELGRFTDRVVANSEPVAELCRKVGIPTEKVMMIPNGIPSETDHGPIVADLRAELGLPPHQPIVGYLGRLVPHKRVHDLIWATDVLRMHGWQMTLLIMGEGSRRPALQRFTRSLELDGMVRFLGHRDDPTSFLQTIDVLALPSRSEGFSNAILEAMHARKPIVATSVAGIDRLITHGENGLLVPPKQPFNLAEAISSLLQDPAKRSRMGEAGYERVHAQFPLDQMVSSYADLYRTLSH